MPIKKNNSEKHSPKLWSLGKGVVHVLRAIFKNGLQDAMEANEATAHIGKLQAARVSQHCALALFAAPLTTNSIRACSATTANTAGAPSAWAQGVKLTKDQRKVFDDSVRDDDQKGREQSFAEPEIEDLIEQVCPHCEGTRLNQTARHVKFTAQHLPITDIASMSVTDVRKWVQSLAKANELSQREQDIARDLLPEIESRLEFLEEVGLGYLTLDRGAPTLSGGEAQRIRLAAQLGSNLQGVCYVLDEPTIGLHARDNQILLNALHKLGDKGNTLVVVNTTKTPSEEPTTSSTLVPARASAVASLVAQGSVKDITDAARFADGQIPTARHEAPAANATCHMPCIQSRQQG